MPSVSVTHFSDPGCPWAWSASPAIAALMWRYGDQLQWRHVMIGLTESGRQYEERGYTPIKGARGYVRFRRFGMPFSPQVKDHVAGTSRGCRAVVATRLQAPEREWAVFRRLQFMQFCSSGLLDEDAHLLDALRDVPGIDAEAIVGAIDREDVVAAYEADRAEARTAENTPAHAQDKTAQTDGPVRYTAPSLILHAGDRELVAGGFQSLMVYDALLANLDPALERRPAPDDVAEVLDAFPDGLTTAEVAEVYASGAAQETDRTAAEEALLGVAAEGRVVRVPVGDDALWLPGSVAATVAHRAGGRFAVA